MSNVPYSAPISFNILPWIDPTLPGQIILTRDVTREFKNRSLNVPVQAQTWGGGTQQLYASHLGGAKRYFVSHSGLYTQKDQSGYYENTD